MIALFSTTDFASVAYIEVAKAFSGYIMWKTFLRELKWGEGTILHKRNDKLTVFSYMFSPLLEVERTASKTQPWT